MRDECDGFYVFCPDAMGIEQHDCGVVVWAWSDGEIDDVLADFCGKPQEGRTRLFGSVFSGNGDGVGLVEELERCRVE